MMETCVNLAIKVFELKILINLDLRNNSLLLECLDIIQIKGMNSFVGKKDVAIGKTAISSSRYNAKFVSNIYNFL